MKRYNKVIHSTRIDAHDDVISKEELENMAIRMAGRCILVSYQHDPRHPPLGRLVSTRIIESEDGEYELVGTLEIWEKNNNLSSLGRYDLKIENNRNDYERLTVLYDHSFLNPEDQQLISEITGMGFESDQVIKKALDPLSVIVICGYATYLLNRAVNGFIDGFTKQLGQDTEVKLGNALKNLLSKPRVSERLVIFRVPIIEDSPEKDIKFIEIILEKPHDIGYLFNHNLNDIESQIIDVVEGEPRTLKIVVEWKDGKPNIQFTIRNDGVPSAIAPISEKELNSMDLSIEGSAQRT
jgi:hypothetical protein